VKIAAYIASCATRGALAWEGFGDLVTSPANPAETQAVEVGATEGPTKNGSGE
jgi:hypothetical protein